jgi:hypothetical protein
VPHQKNDKKKIKNPNVNIKNSLCRFLLKKEKSTKENIETTTIKTQCMNMLEGIKMTGI